MQTTRFLPVVKTLHARHQIDTAKLTKVPHTAGERFHRLHNAVITGHDVPRSVRPVQKPADSRLSSRRAFLRIRQARIFPTSRARSTGLVSKSAQPTEMLRSRSLASA